MRNTAPIFTIFQRAGIVILFFVLSFSSLGAQVKIGDNPQNIDPNSLLELESNTMAMVLSRVTTSEMESISPLQGALLYNTDEECIFYYNGASWINLCEGSSSLSIVDNNDNTYTVNDGTNPPFTITALPETVTSFVQNTDGTYTYTNEANVETTFASSALSITDNQDNTYTVNDGTNPPFKIGRAHV